MNDLFLYLAGGALVVIGLCLGSYLSSRSSKALIQHLQLKYEGVSSLKSQSERKVLELKNMLMEKVRSDIDVKIEKDRELATKKEPTENDIKKRMKETGNESFYDARERLREAAYGGKPPHGFASWGDYWKSY